MRRDFRAPRPRPGRGHLARSFGPLFLSACALAAGCGESQEGGGTSGGGDLNSSGLMLPPGFKPVDLPIDRRKAIFHEAHHVRARAVQEANRQLPMDEASLPHGDTPAFDKRVADHKAIIDGILEKNLADLADRHKISSEDLAKIEEEASRLRWIPPEDPKPDEETK